MKQFVTKYRWAMFVCIYEATIKESVFVGPHTKFFMKEDSFNTLLF